MLKAMVRVPSSQERAYAAQLVRLAEAERRVTALRAERDALRQDLAPFEAEYVRRVGGLVAAIERVGRDIAAYQHRIAAHHAAAAGADRAAADRGPDEAGDPDPEEVFTAGAGGTRAGGGRTGTATPGPRRPRVAPEVEAEAKRLYRALAKRHHPDLARTDTERRRREAMMLRINAAFRHRDVAALRSCWREADGDDRALAGHPAAARLAWAIRETARQDALARDLEAQVAAIRGGETFRLWRRHQAGEPVLDALENDLEVRLAAAGHRLDRLVVAYQRAQGRRRRRADPALV